MSEQNLTGDDDALESRQSPPQNCGGEQKLICVICFESAASAQITHWCHLDCAHILCMECSAIHFMLHSLNYCPTCRETPKKLIISREEAIERDVFNEILNRNIKLEGEKFYFDTKQSLENFMRLFQLFCYICNQSKKSKNNKIETFKNFAALMDHMKLSHSMYYCDMCLENLKIFPSQRKVYKLSALEKHRFVGDNNFFNASSKIDKVLGLQSSSMLNVRISRHFYCRICTSWFFDINALYKHCRESHLFCHYCDIHSNMFYENYDLLFEHFKELHFVCLHKKCKDDQYVNVFDTRSKFAAHMKNSHNIHLKGDAGARYKQLAFEDLKENPERNILFTLSEVNQKRDERKNYTNSTPSHEQMLETALINRLEELSERDLLDAQNLSQQQQERRGPVNASAVVSAVQEFPELGGDALSSQTERGIIARNRRAERLHTANNIRVEYVNDNKRSRRGSKGKGPKKQIDVSVELSGTQIGDKQQPTVSNLLPRDTINVPKIPQYSAQNASVNREYAKASTLLKSMKDKKIKMKESAPTSNVGNNNHSNCGDSGSNSDCADVLHVSRPLNRMEENIEKSERIRNMLEYFKQLRTNNREKSDWQKPPGFN